MYEFSTTAERTAFLNALDTEAMQHIRGILHLAGRDVKLNYYDAETYGEIEGTPRIEQQCVENDDTFMFGEMYVGSVELIIHYPASLPSSFKGAQVSLEFGVDVPNNDPIYIPLGVWDIQSADRLTGENRWQLKGTDHLNRLRTAINDDTVGIIKLPAIIGTITRTVNVQFEQTVEQIAAMIGHPANQINCVEFSETCWEEVKQIAQLMGGFAFANRSGKIEFRQFGTSSVQTITASQRFKFKPSDYNYGVDTITYIDAKKHSYTAQTGTTGGTVNINFYNNKYIFTSSGDEEYFEEWIDPIAEKFTQTWYSGTVDYYGNPALDLGDMITVAGGLAGETAMPMLITGLSWGFRAPQTITSAGLPDTGIGASSASSGGSSYSGGGSSQSSTASVLHTVPLDIFPDEFEGRYTAAEGGFGARQSIDGFVNVGITILADSSGTASFTVLLDEIAQVLQPSATTHNSEIISLFASVPISPDEGSHTVRVEVRGSGTITDISAVVVGQDISPESPDVTTESDYTYTVENGAATITGYIGTALRPRIPDKLGGAAVTAIAGGAFTGTAVKNVTIPEGVTTIE